MILVGGYVKFAPGAIEKLKPAMQKVIAATRAEQGCIDYDFAVDVADPTRLVVFERWENQKSLDAHAASAHVATWRAAAAAAGPSERKLAVWEVGEGRSV